MLIDAKCRASRADDAARIVNNTIKGTIGLNIDTITTCTYQRTTVGDAVNVTVRLSIDNHIRARNSAATLIDDAASQRG